MPNSISAKPLTSWLGLVRLQLAVPATSLPCGLHRLHMRPVEAEPPLVKQTVQLYLITSKTSLALSKTRLWCILRVDESTRVEPNRPLKYSKSSAEIYAAIFSFGSRICVASSTQPFARSCFAAPRSPFGFRTRRHTNGFWVGVVHVTQSPQRVANRRPCRRLGSEGTSRPAPIRRLSARVRIAQVQS